MDSSCIGTSRDVALDQAAGVACRASRERARSGGRASRRASLGWASSPRAGPRRRRRRPERAAPTGTRADSDRAARFAFHDAARMTVERRRERGLVRLGVPARMRLGGESRGDERLVHSVAGERIDETGGVADERERGRAPPVRRARASEAGARERSAARAARHRARAPAGRGGRGDAAPPHPPADAEVRVVALREHPAVPARHDAELDPGGARTALRGASSQRDVPLERDAANDPAAEPGAPRDDAVRAVGADEECSTHRDPPIRATRRVVELDARDLAVVPEVCARAAAPARRDGGRAVGAGSSR